MLHVGFLQLWRAGATLHCGVQASHCGGFSCCRAQALGTLASVFVAHGPQSLGLAVVAHRLSCSSVSGILPDQGLNLCPCTDRQILIHCATREVLFSGFFLNFWFFESFSPNSNYFSLSRTAPLGQETLLYSSFADVSHNEKPQLEIPLLNFPES